MAKIKIEDAEEEYEEILLEAALEIQIEMGCSFEEALKITKKKMSEGGAILLSNRGEAQISTFKKVYGKLNDE